MLTATFSLESLLGVGHCNGGSEIEVRKMSPCADTLCALSGQGQVEDSALLNHSFGSDAVIPSPRQAQDYFSGQYSVALPLRCLMTSVSFYCLHFSIFFHVDVV